MTIRRLIQDRELELLDGTKLIGHDKYDKLIENPANSGHIRRIHPSFRVWATAEPPNTKEQNWLTSEVLSLFAFHRAEALTTRNIRAIVKAKFKYKLNDNHERLIALIDALTTSAANDLQLANIARQFSLRQVLRMSNKLFEFPSLDLRELIENAVLYEFMPKLNKDVFNEFLNKNGLPKTTANREVASVTFPSKQAQALSLHDLAKIPDTLFYDNSTHSTLLANLYRDFKLNEHILLIGNQGTGKNKVPDGSSLF